MNDFEKLTELEKRLKEFKDDLAYTENTLKETGRHDIEELYRDKVNDEKHIYELEEEIAKLKDELGIKEER